MLAPTTVSAVPLAFPGAEGCGAGASGGRGGRILKVTSLADAGPGSLRAAVEADGARLIVFDVSGTIDLESPIVVRNGAVTIAGQSSPGGVALRGRELVIDADNVIVRHIRSRPGAGAGAEIDAISVVGGSPVMLDHVSASWSVDETLSVSQAKTDKHPFLGAVTVQWSIIGESLNRSVHSKGAHGYGSLVRGHSGACFSFHHNLWAHHKGRMPRPGNFAAAADDPVGPQMQFWNNVFYNWGGRTAGYNADTDAISRYDFIANWYRPGPDSKAALMFEEDCGLCRSHVSANAMNGDVPQDQSALLVCAAPACAFSAARQTEAPFTPQSAEVAAKAVLAAAGAFPRDAVDARLVDEVESGSGGIIDDPSERGGWPAIVAAAAPADRDGDAMPDAWEEARGLDADDPADAHRDDDGDLYPNVEDYLNELAARLVSAPIQR